MKYLQEHIEVNGSSEDTVSILKLLDTDIYTYYKVYNYLNRPPKRITGFMNIDIQRELAKKKEV